MAKVYSWAINNRTYAYIVNPSNTNEAYVGAELQGNRLQIVADWAQNATDTQYDAQFAKMVALCESNGYDVSFESALSYRTVSTTCDNLRGPAGRGIESVQYSHSTDGQSVYIITYDDGATDSFSVRDGRDGRDGVDGTPGAKGDAGVSSKFIMIYTSGRRSDGTLFTPERPQGGSFDFLTGNAVYPDGWAPSDSEIIPPVWMSSRTFTTSELSTDREWSYPTQITGENGAPGVDGVSTEFIYMLSDVRPSNVSELPSENTNGYVPEEYGWSGSPNGVTENNTTEWCCIRKMVENVGWGLWEGPTIWAKYGVNGQDGDGVQYIYMRNKGALPPNPTPFNWSDSTSDYQLKNNEWVPQIGSYINYTGESITLTDEFFWSDNPQDVDAGYQFQWVAVRKYRKGDDGTVKWQPFSDPTLWGKFGQNGNNGTSVRTLYAVSESTSNHPQVPEGVTATGDWQSGFPSDYEFGKNVVWGISAEIWAHNNEFVENYKVVSTKDSTGNVIAPSDATGNSVEVNSIPNEKREDFKYLIFNGDYYEWVGGWSQPFLVTGVKGKDGDAINYNSRYFAYGYVDSTPYAFTSKDPKNPGISLDGKGRTINWYDYPDTAYVGTDNDERRWYQCDVHINGDTQEIENYGPVLPCNGRDGNTLPGNYTEFRFAVTPTEEKPILVQINDEGRIIRVPELWSDDKKEQWGWFTTDDKLPEKTPGGAVWEIWATINGTTEEVVTQSDGTSWSGPMRVSGERGEQGIPGPVGKRGITGIPGAMINPMYCLGTEGRNGNGESFDDSGDGYFGSNLWANDVLPEDLEGWYSTPPYSAFLDATGNTQVESYAGDTANKGRVIRLIATTVNSGVTETFYTYYLISDSGIKTIRENVPQKDELHIYIWCTQGKDIWESGTVGDDDDGDTVTHKRTGVDWCDPFRLQGTDGLRGMVGNRGQVIYPMGIYNEEEVYITTETKAPYVYDPNDGLFYVYNIVDKPWVGKLPDNYQSVKIDKNGNEDDGAEYYKYSVDGTDGNWIPEQNTPPSLNYANHIAAGSTPAWERFESFKALYTQIGIIENGMIGSAVYNNEFMFSQQGLESDGSTYSTDYEKFLSGYAYNDKGKVENGETKHWYYKGTDNYISDKDVNPYEPTSETNSICIHDFQPNVCINFKTGEMWLSGGKVNFDSDGGGYLANHYINWTDDGTVIIGKPGDSANGIVMSSTGMTIGPLNAYKLEMNGTISAVADAANQALNRLNVMGEDGYVSPEEQRRLINEKSNVDNEHSKLVEKAEYYGLTATTSTFYNTYTGYTSAYNRFTASTEYYTSKDKQITTATDSHYKHIKIDIDYSGTGTTGQYYGNIAAYYGFKQDLQNALVSAAENSAADKAYDLVINDKAFINDLTVSKLNTTPDKTDNTSRILIENNDIKCYSSTSTAETLTVSGSALDIMEAYDFHKYYHSWGGTHHSFGNETTYSNTQSNTATTLTFFLKKDEIAVLSVPSFDVIQYILFDSIPAGTNTETLTGSTTANLTLFIATGATEDSVSTYYKTHTLLYNFKISTSTYNSSSNAQAYNSGQTATSKAEITLNKGDVWYSIKIISSITVEGNCSKTSASINNSCYSPKVDITCKTDINKTEIGSNGFRMISDTLHKAEFITNDENTEFILYANGNGIKVNDNGLYLCSNGIWAKLVFNESSNGTLTTNFVKAV